jgi:hypothetical protein
MIENNESPLIIEEAYRRAIRRLHESKAKPELGAQRGFADSVRAESLETTLVVHPRSSRPAPDLRCRATTMHQDCIGTLGMA